MGFLVIVGAAVGASVGAPEPAATSCGPTTVLLTWPAVMASVTCVLTHVDAQALKLGDSCSAPPKVEFIVTLAPEGKTTVHAKDSGLSDTLAGHAT